jgi:predicted Zn-dependent peptidase
MSSTLLSKTPLNAPTIYTLPNGLTIVAEQMPVDAVNLNVWLNVGSANESEEINGMAHFLEHMMFKGTPNIPMGEFEKRIEQQGAVTNAATSQEYTHYYITTAPQDFAQLAPLQIDVVLNPEIPDEAFERERLVVLEEIRRSEDNPQRRTYHRAMETCFATLPYRRQVLGPAAVIEQLTPQQMRVFHRHWYHPTAITTAVVGNLPVEELIATVAEGFEQHSPASWQKSTSAATAQAYTPESAFAEIVRREYTDESLQQARLVMMWRVPGMNELTQTYPLDILAVILGQGKTARLFRDLREERGLVSRISVSNLTYNIQGAFYISAYLPAENLEVVEAAIREHIRSLHHERVGKEVLARVCTKVANRFIFANERPGDRANLYGYYLSQVGDLDPAFNYPATIRSLTPQDLQQAAQTYLNPDAYGVVIQRPTN